MSREIAIVAALALFAVSAKAANIDTAEKAMAIFDGTEVKDSANLESAGKLARAVNVPNAEIKNAAALNAMVAAPAAAVKAAPLKAAAPMKKRGVVGAWIGVAWGALIGALIFGGVGAIAGGGVGAAIGALSGMIVGGLVGALIGWSVGW